MFFDPTHPNAAAMFTFLDALRASGVINMFAAPAVLAEEFDLMQAEAAFVVKAWMKTFKDGVPVVDRLAAVVEG